MRNLYRIYKEMSFERKTILKTIAGLCFSTVLASGKLIIGLFTDYNLCTIAIYTFALLLSKLECVLGVKSSKRTFKTRNILIAVFLFVASFFYIGFMCRMLFIRRQVKEYTLVYVVLLAFISFAELGFASAGIIRTKNKGHFYRDIKIINFCIALIAILTTQMAILDYATTVNTDVFNACTGIGVGVFIALCAVYISVAPKISVMDREHNVFILKDENKNNLTEAEDETLEIILTKSRVYGSYVYRAKVQNGRIDGNIGREKSLWVRMHVLLKILCCILSEILIFVWFVGRVIFFFRTIDLPRKLEKIMLRNGFHKLLTEPIELRLPY